MATATPLTAPAEMVCAVCKKADGDLSLCKQCRGIYYCSKECQKKDWGTHKILCKAYGNSPRPEATSGEDFHRIIVFDPEAANKTPKIVWVDSKKEWVLDHLYSKNPLKADGTGITADDRPCTARFEAIAPAGQTYDHHLQCLTPWHVPSMPGVNRAYIHQTIRATLESSRLPIHYHFPSDLIYIMSRWEGMDKWGEILIPGGPKLQDMTLADFSRAVHWLSDFGIDNARLPGASRTVEDQALDLIFLQRLSVSAFKSCVRNFGMNVEQEMAKNEHNARKMREDHAAGRQETPDLALHGQTVYLGDEETFMRNRRQTIYLGDEGSFMRNGRG